MAHRTGMEPVAHPGRGRADIFFPGKVTGLDSEIPCVVGHRNVVPKEIVVAFARANAAIQHHRITDIELSVHRAKGVLGARLAPGLGVVVAHITGVRDLGIDADLHAFLGRVGVTFGVADVRRESQAFTAKVQAQYRHLAIHTLVIPFGVARLLHAIETNPELVFFTKAPPHIHRPAKLVIGGIAAGERSDGLVGGAFGHHVDPAPTLPRGEIPLMSWLGPLRISTRSAISMSIVYVGRMP